MQPTCILAIGVSLLLLPTNAFAIEKRDNLSVVAFPLQRVVGSPTIQNTRLHKRSFQSPLLNFLSITWVLSISLGTPPRTIHVRLNTGSSDLVVETDSSDYCTTNPSICSVIGTYDANSSSTYQYVNSHLNVEYADLESATGDYAKDDLKIGGVLIKVMQFGIMYHSTVVSGLLGVGFPVIEFLAASGYGEYNNLPILLVNQGYIQSAAYSLWFNGEHCLVTLPLVLGPYPSIEAFFVILQEVQMRNSAGNLIDLNGGSNSCAFVLDSGTTMTLVPAALAQSIFTAVNAVISNSSAYVDCSLASSLFTVEYKFTGITISVPMSQLILPQNLSPTQCLFGIQSSTIGSFVLGDSFLSSAYAVYDLDNKNVPLAQAVINATSENIIEIGSGPDAVPSITGVNINPTTTTRSMITLAPKPANCNHVRFHLFIG
ncbi:acid protease [Hyaloscypha hepaticicola]|uniref:Acid protease n=1 Tax=Hyaloscypha hepaticicola TaxID=2082293 RepID=A0A2J6PKY4_9HELO|nr:acid protease [Hyaloscypha hepaticicola]